MVVVAIALGIAALLATGNLLLGALLMPVVNVLDGVDGKLARIKGTASNLGQLEHAFDLLYEHAWYVTFAWGAFAQLGQAWVLAVGLAALVADGFARHLTLTFRQQTGVSLSDYTKFDRLFRRMDGRRNVYTVYMIVCALAGVPWLAVILVLAHASLTAAVYVVSAGLSLRALDRGTTRKAR